MTHPIYTLQQLQELKLGEIKAIASRMGVAPEGDKRNKDNWVSAIVKRQNSQTQKIATATQAPQLQPTRENPFTVEEAAKSGYVFSWAGVGNFLTIKGCNEQGMVVVNDGCDDLCFTIQRIELMTYGEVVAKPQQNDEIVVDEQAVAQVELDQYIEEQADDYLFHDEQQPANLPQIGDTHFISDFLLRCAQVGGDYATVWDVYKDDSLLGEVRMGWDTFWSHTMTLGTFATPQEAVIDLYESLQALLEEQRIQSEEAIAFEKVADNRWESTVNGILVRITLEDGEYRCNLSDAVFADYDGVIVGALVAVARVQEKRLSERTERANTIQVLEHRDDKFVVQGSDNKSRYTVRPKHLDPNQRCECADCRHRGSKCKHQIAVENFLNPNLEKELLAA
ncbi:hypothetical protein A6S26_05545 [Nostoc sp. ATCC 43529]|nr:hypothetical protein A6S26_05545 [Nostoc sp. ATCC 43529]